LYRRRAGVRGGGARVPADAAAREFPRGRHGRGLWFRPPLARIPPRARVPRLALDVLAAAVRRSGAADEPEAHPPRGAWRRRCGRRAGCDQVADAIIGYGSEALRREVLPRIAAGEATFWQGFSEPGAGSDLLALKTRGRRDGPHYVIDGHKIWSSHAGIADYGLVLARTDPSAPRHRGLSMLVVDNRLPGMDIRPIRSMTGKVYHYQV